MQKSSPSKAGKKKPSNKLALSKKSRSKKSDKNMATGDPRSFSLSDLNETCEFKDGKSMADLRGSGGGETLGPGYGSKLGEDDSLSDVSCHICQKNLSHMNTQRQQQHVNRCIDRLEEKAQKEKVEKQALESAKTAVLDCPMCGQKLKTMQARISHLKKCSQQLGVATEKMLQLVKCQEEERQTMLSVGVIPPSLKSQIKSTDNQKQRKKKVTKEPKSKFDEDVQMAMAISSSLADQECMARSDLVGQLKQTRNSLKEKKKSKNKKNSEERCEMMELTHADRQKRFADRANSIILAEENFVLMEQPMKLFQSKLVPYSNGIGLWNKAMPAEDDDREKFYVDALMPPVQVSGAQTGRNFKRLSSIPGREKSFITNKVADDAKDMRVAEDVFTASTQTAVVLAELAVDNDDHLSQSPVDMNATGFLIEEETLVLSDEEKQRERDNLGLCLKSLVNNPQYSDITFVTSDGQKLYAHKIIVTRRCPRLIQDDKWREINLPLSSKSALSLLNYLYTGELTLTESTQSELVGFCERLDLEDLGVLCQKLKCLNKNDEKMDEKIAESIDDLNETRLDIVLKEIWGESDSEPDEKETDTKDDALTEEDYQDIRSSQRQKLQLTKEDGTQKRESSDGGVNSDYLADSVNDDSTDSDNDEYSVSKKHSAVCSIQNLAENGSKQDSKKDDRSKSNLSKSFECEKSPAMKEVSLYDENNDKSSDDEVIMLDDKHNISANNGAKHALNLKRTRQNINTAKIGQINIQVENNVNRQATDVHSNNDSNNDAQSPVAKKIKLNCDIDVKLKVNFCYESNDDANSSYSPESISRELAKHQSKKETEKSDVAYCGLNFDTSFTQSQHGSRLSVSSTTGSMSKLDSSSTDLFGSPSPRKKSSPRKKPLFKSSPNKMHADNGNELTDSEKATNISGGDNLEETYSTGPKSDFVETEEIDLSQSSNEFSDKDVEITGYDFMETSQNCSNMEQPKDVSMARNTLRQEKEDEVDIEITGDNFMEIPQNSPKFEKTKTMFVSEDKNRIADTEARKFKEKDDKNSTTASTENGLDNMSEGAFNTDMNDLETYDFNESFNESFSESRGVADDKVDRKGSFESDIVTGERTHSTSCDKVYRPENKEESIQNVGAVKISDESSDFGKEGNCSKGIVRDDHDEDIRDATVEATLEVTVAADSADDNVWDDFEEDYGYADIISSQDRHQNYRLTDVRSDVNTAEHRYKTTPKFNSNSPATSIQQAETVKEFKKTSFKTPSAGNGPNSRKPNWVVPSPFTPMPSYDTMNTPMLKKAVQKFGVKPVGKKRMVKVLKDIYHQTHQYETDSEFEDDDRNTKSETTATVAKTIGSSAESTTNSVQSSVPTRVRTEMDDYDVFPSSQTDISSSQESDVSELLEETCIHPPSDDSDVSASPQKGVDLTKQLSDFIYGNKDLRIRMLMYEPIELDVFKKELKEAGIKCNMDRVMDFLDERCIAFTTKNSRKRVPSNRGRKKTAKATENS